MINSPSDFPATRTATSFRAVQMDVSPPASHIKVHKTVSASSITFLLDPP